MKYTTALLLTVSAVCAADKVENLPPTITKTITRIGEATKIPNSLILPPGAYDPTNTTAEQDAYIQSYLAEDAAWLEAAVKDWDSNFEENSRHNDTDAIRFPEGIPMSSKGPLLEGQICRPISILKIRVKSLSKSVYKLGADGKSGKPVLKKMLLWKKSIQELNSHLLRTSQLSRDAQTDLALCYAEYTKAAGLMLQMYAHRSSFAKPNHPWRCHHHAMLGDLFREYKSVAIQMYGTDQADTQHLLNDQFDAELPSWYKPDASDPYPRDNIAAWTREQDIPFVAGKKGSFQVAQKAWENFRGSKEGNAVCKPINLSG